jgi:large subunit ribosomal protein L32e
MNKLLELRKKINKKRPAFRQQDSHRRGRLHPDKWRSPKGLHSTIRKNIWGKPSMVKNGFRGPAAVRGLDSKGMTPVTLYSAGALESLDPKTNSIIIGNVGNRKRIELLKACQNKKFNVLNSKNIEADIKKITDGLAARKERKKKAADAKKPVAATAKPAKKEAKPETTDAEEQKKQDQQELQKVITKRE